MSDSQAFEAAARRLAAALDALEAAVERRYGGGRSEADLAAQLQALGNDRVRLAAELDAVSAHAHELETTNRDIARRLDGAIESIRSVIKAEE